MEYPEIEQLVNDARVLLKTEDYGLDLLFFLRKSLGYRDLFETKLGTEMVNGIDGLTSECDFVPSYHEITYAPLISAEKISSAKEDLTSYLSTHKTLIKEILTKIAALQC